MNWLLPLMMLFLLFVLSAWLLARAQQLHAASGLPKGQVVYEDVSGLARKPLYSQALGLTGKPDYLLRDPQGNLIPVEVKSGNAPRQGRPYKAHSLQLAVYFALVEDVLDCPAPYGLIRYRNRTLQVSNSAALRAELLDRLAHMRRLLGRANVARNHEQPQRCARCSLAHACDERLA